MNVTHGRQHSQLSTWRKMHSYETVVPYNISFALINFRTKYVNVNYHLKYKGGPQIQYKVLSSSVINQSLSVWLSS
jgi:hypothetical protein